MSVPVEGEWYWVRSGPGSDWFPAKADTGASGGWTNDDTWEDFLGDIMEWSPIRKPKQKSAEPQK